MVTATPHPPRPATPPQAAPGPQLNVLAQYTKDLSFENPNAPSSLSPQSQQPAINIQINVSANTMSRKPNYEVIAVGRRQGGDRRQGIVQLRPRLCRRVPHPQCAEGKPASADHDRMSAAAVPVRAGDRRDSSVRDGGFPSADAGSRGFRQLLYRQNMEKQAGRGRLRRPSRAKQARAQPGSRYR